MKEPGTGAERWRQAPFCPARPQLKEAPTKQATESEAALNKLCGIVDIDEFMFDTELARKVFAHGLHAIAFSGVMPG